MSTKSNACRRLRDKECHPGTARSTKGFSIIELTIALVITLTIAAVSIPKLYQTVQRYRTEGDARSMAEEVSLAKMRSAADFTESRLYADFSAKAFGVQVWTTVSSNCPSLYPNGCWMDQEGKLLSGGSSFGFGSLSSPPANTQTTLAQAPNCLDNGGSSIANTACIIFNSRGVPVDTSGTPTGSDALYLTDGSSVYGVTVSATGLIRTWRTDASTANWQNQ